MQQPLQNVAEKPEFLPWAPSGFAAWDGFFGIDFGGGGEGGKGSFPALCGESPFLIQFISFASR